MLQRLYDWAMTKAASPYAVWWMCAFAFAEATFFPLPADVLLIPMVLAVRQSAWRLAFFAALASSIGGCFGWAIGYFLFEEVGRPILELYGYMAEFARLQELYRHYGELIVAIGGLTPIPYKAVTITSGVAQMDFWSFNLASVGSRILRFYLVCGALYWFGPPVKRFIDNNLHLSALIGLALFVGGFVLLAYVV
jgi:membrane protein YqaA with SNARE-associated domain